MNDSALELVDESDDTNFGTCCACGEDDGTVRNIVMMDRRAPVAGTGWGCVLCGLPSDGASYILCDRCLEANAEPKEVICGFLKDKKRCPVSDLSPEKFDHDMRKHFAFERHA